MNEFNIASNTQIGRIEIPLKVYPHENAYQIQGYSRSGEFIENLVTDNLIEFFKRWFNLAGIIEMLRDVNEYFSGYGFGDFQYIMNNLYYPVMPVEKTYNNIPVTFVNTNNGVSINNCPVVFSNKRNRTSLSYNEILQGRNYSR